MKKGLVVVDFQNDFIDGSLGTPEAQAIVSQVVDKIKCYSKEERLATMDTHFPDYLTTQEGRNLPILHCQKGTSGWEMRKEAQLGYAEIFEKNTFGSLELAQYVQKNQFDQLELIGICTDICVISNALLIKAYAPEVELIVDAACCAGVSPEKHEAALEAMRSCQVQVI